MLSIYTTMVKPETTIKAKEYLGIGLKSMERKFRLKERLLKYPKFGNYNEKQLKISSFNKKIYHIS